MILNSDLTQNTFHNVKHVKCYLYNIVNVLFRILYPFLDCIDTYLFCYFYGGRSINFDSCYYFSLFSSIIFFIFYHLPEKLHFVLEQRRKFFKNMQKLNHRKKICKLQTLGKQKRRESFLTILTTCLSSNFMCSLIYALLINMFKIEIKYRAIILRY